MVVGIVLLGHGMGQSVPTVPPSPTGSAMGGSNDGWLDLLFVNGYVYPQVDKNNWGTTFKQRALLFHNLDGRLHLMPAVEGTALAKLSSAHGLGYGDLFNDGKIDAVISNLDGTPFLFRNVYATANHWVGLKLTGGPGSPSDAVGATVYLTSKGVRQRADVISGGSYVSSSDQRLLGAANAIDDIEVHWPSGPMEHFALKAVDGIFDLHEVHGTKTALR